MAQSCHLQRGTLATSSHTPKAPGFRPFVRFQRQAAVRVQASGNTSPAAQQPSRRALLSGLTAAPLLANLISGLPSLADEKGDAPVDTSKGSDTYVDPEDNFSIVVPAGWETGSGFIGGNAGFTGASGQRRTLAFFPPGEASNTNVTITITNTSAEFTRLGSFGSAIAFGENLVNSMDRSFLLRAPQWARRSNDPHPGTIARLVDAKELTSSRGGSQYFVEYTIRKDVEAPQRHMASVVALANNGRYNRLYTVTAQCLEDQYKDYQSVIGQVLSSFEPPPAKA